MKISFARTLLIIAFASFGLMVGCEDRYSTQEAYEFCTDLQEQNSSSASPESFADCVDCHESCGGACTLQGTTPETYVCPDELGEEGEGGSGGGE
jgi:hypothetical protein